MIYKGERETGITWHYVTAGVDEGNIIVQKRCEIGPDEKAYELTERLMNLASEGFAECFDTVLAENVQAVPQDLSGERRLYRSKEIPGTVFWMFRVTRRRHTDFCAVSIMERARYFRHFVCS